MHLRNNRNVKINSYTGMQRSNAASPFLLEERRKGQARDKEGGRKELEKYCAFILNCSL